MDGRTRCRGCGKVIPATANFCAFCGQPQIETNEPPVPAQWQDWPVARRLARAERRLDLIETLTGRLDHRLQVIERAVPVVTVEPVAELEAVPVLPAAEPATPVPPPIAEVLEEAAPVSPPEPVAPAPAPPLRPALWTVPPVTAPKAPSRTAVEWEQLIGGRGLAFAGGLAMIVGAVFFLSLAFSRGWIGPGPRVAIGVVASVAMMGGGAWFFHRREALFGHVVTAVGLGVLSLSMMAATRLYDLIPLGLGLLGALAGAVIAAIIAVRYNTQIVAAFGIAAALAAPPVLGASADATTIAFLGASLVGATAIALYRTWGWLAPLAFVLSAPQAAAWFVEDAPRAGGLAALAAFWLLHAIAAGGEEFRVRRSVLRPSSASLLLADAAFLVGMGFALLDGDAERWRGAFLLAVAVAHGAIGGYFLREEGDCHPFGLLAAGTGIAALTMAVPVQFGGPVVPIAWAAEATALAWVASVRRHRYSAGAAIVLGSLAIGHLLTIEYPLSDIETGFDRTRPFLTAEGGTLAFVLAALAVAAYLARLPVVRTALTTIGFALVILAMPFELSGVGLLAGWSAIGVAALATRRLPVVAVTIDDLPVTKWPFLATLFRWSVEVVAAVAAVLVVDHLIRFEVPLAEFDSWTRPATPFSDTATLGAAIAAAAAVVGAWATPRWPVRRIALAAAFGVAAYLIPFEVGGAATVVMWAALAIGALALAAWDEGGARIYQRVGAVLLGAGSLVAIGWVAPPERLIVDTRSGVDHPLFWSGATAAFGALAIVLALTVARDRTARWARATAILAASFVVYLLSVGIVDEFQRQVGGDVDLDSLRRRAQVALSILWAALGGAAFAAGIVRFGPTVRAVGLGLLGLATAKVFVYDLASLNTSYRVLSFIGLGILLLASSYVYQRLIGHPNAKKDDGDTGDRQPPATGPHHWWNRAAHG